MTTIKQIRAPFRPLIERNPDLVQTGTFALCRTPVHRVARRITIDRTGDAKAFDPRWNLTPVYAERHDLYEQSEAHDAALRRDPSRRGS